MDSGVWRSGWVSRVFARGAAVFAFFGGFQPKRAAQPPKPGAADRFWGELAVQDWIVLAYLSTLLALSIAGEGARRRAAIGWVLFDLGFFLAMLLVARGPMRGGHPLRAALAYRAGLFVAIFGSFAELPYILPVVRSHTVDAELYAWDRATFRIEPAEALDRFVTPALTEWFSFFYLSYFVILGSFVLGSMLFARRPEALAELSLGIVLVFCLGHLLYIVVPGRGPYHHLASHFAHPLEGRTWWPLLARLVDGVEPAARTDIFPSLHTAVPTYLAVFARRHRAHVPFRFVWAPVAFFASQIIASTMYLRWHYLADVVAGLLLCGEVSVYSRRISVWESQRRRALGKAAVWTPLFGRGSSDELPRSGWICHSEATEVGGGRGNHEQRRGDQHG